MKIRCGFVTNSSSSSFIIRAKKKIDDQYKNMLGKDMTKDNFIDILIEESWIDTEKFAYSGISREEVMRLLNIDNRAYQLLALMAEDYDSINECIELAKYFDKNPDAVLNSISIDWGFEYDNPKLKEFMESAEVVLKND